jgi:glycosyltransferase involved in cell wall biosynthesis
MLEVLLGFGAVFSLVALVMMLVNLSVYTPTRPEDRPRGEPESWPTVSVCIPARNEESNVEACVRSALAQDYPHVRVLVYDDHSTDATPRILSRLENEDRRVVAVPVEELPSGWNGKQFACDRMGRFAEPGWCLFTDADVRFEPGCLRRSMARAEALNADLISTIPRQVTGTLGEALIIPLIHFILLSYLPMPRMRRTTDPSTSAGVGQFLLVRREAYIAAGGHEPFKDSMHDGIKMPRTLRRAGYRTDLFDGTDLVHCRMYRGLAATWRGFAKNAYEGLGSIGLLVFVTILHLVGHVLPWVYLLAAAAGWALDGWSGTPVGVGLALTAVGWSLTERVYLALRFQQSILSALLHPVGIALMTAIQWHSLWLSLRGSREWRGRRAGVSGPVSA